MAKKLVSNERIRALVAELLAEEEGQAEEGRREDINDIEEAMIEISNRVACELGVQKLARHMSQPPEHPPCPDCGQPGQLAGKHSRRLISRRGAVPLTETKYRCPKCRRHFFPSDGGLGRGSQV